MKQIQIYLKKLKANEDCILWIYFLNKNSSGISRYYYNLAKILIEKDINFKIVSYYIKVIFKIWITILKRDLFKEVSTLKDYRKNFQFSNDLCIDKLKPNIVHDTYYQEQFNNFKSLKVITFYDSFTKNFQIYIVETRKFLDKYDLIICISEMKNDLMNFYGILKN